MNNVCLLVGALHTSGKGTDIVRRAPIDFIIFRILSLNEKIESCIHIARRQQRSGSFLGTLSKEKNAEFKTDPCAILTTASGF